MFYRRSSWRTLAAISVLLACSVLTSAAPFEQPPAPPQIAVVEKTDQNPFGFEVVGLPQSVLQRLAKLEPTDPEFSKLFSIAVAGDRADPSIPPVGGQYRVDRARLVFVPRFPPQAGLTYRALLHWGDDDDKASKIERDVTIPKPEADAKRAATQVQHIYPTSDVLPENHLRFYIHFTQPMSRTIAYQNLELLDEQGQVVEAAFLELGEELWDSTHQRFTLLLDPGRIKRGLKPREEDGPILEAGKKYTLVVKRSWLDGRGQMLKADVKKTFTAGPALDKPLDVQEWKLEAPAPDARSLLTVRFPRPLDHALLNRLLTVTDRDGHPIQGQHIVCNGEKRWTFVPDEKWQPGSYNLVVDTVLEDSAGNRIGRAFEVDQVEDVTDELQAEYVKIPFEVKPRDAAAIQP